MPNYQFKTGEIIKYYGYFYKILGEAGEVRFISSSWGKEQVNRKDKIGVKESERMFLELTVKELNAHGYVPVSPEEAGIEKDGRRDTPCNFAMDGITRVSAHRFGTDGRCTKCGEPLTTSQDAQAPFANGRLDAFMEGRRASLREAIAMVRKRKTIYDEKWHSANPHDWNIGQIQTCDDILYALSALLDEK